MLASQATQVYYVSGLKDTTWSAVMETKPRNVYDIPVDQEESFQEEETHFIHDYVNENA